MSINRRQFLAYASAATAALPLMPQAAMADNEILIGGLHDESGVIDLIGKPMAQLMEFAVHEINASGGLLGRKLRLQTYDPQSNQQLYAQLAQKLAVQDKASVVHGGITSSSREVMRPALRRAKTLYFYNTLYEGGVCDRNEFTTGTTPAQTVANLIRYVMNRFGRRVYIVAADYNFGQISAAWVKKFVEAGRGEVLGTEFFPLDVDNFGSSISKIQMAKPDFVMSILVGAAHLSFYRQWAAAGLVGKIPMASSTFGAGGVDFVILRPEECNGLINCSTYVEGIQSPRNQEFLSRLKGYFGDRTPVVAEMPCTTYEGVWLWAKGVEKAGSVDRMAVIEALESGISFEGPSGTVTIDPLTHHCVRDVHVAELQDRKWKVLETIRQVPPSDTSAVCDLKRDPNSTVQHTIRF
ncbi:urea ABC transporter substrate-binding protein [Bradyrhizobium liaoningense]